MKYALSILVLTEDGTGHLNLVLVLRKAVRLIDRDTQTQRIDWQPQNRDARVQMAGNRWKSTSKHDYRKIVAFRRAIINKLLEPRGFVAMHVDADVRWSDGGSGNLAKFQALIVDKVRSQVASHLATRSGDDIDLDAVMQRLLPVHPFYSIEAWLFQSIDALIDSDMRHGCGECAQKLAESWRLERATLDDQEQPKELPCFKDRCNSELAKHFPADVVYQANASFAAMVEEWGSRPELTTALRLTWTPSPPSPP